MAAAGLLSDRNIESNCGRSKAFERSTFLLSHLSALHHYYIADAAVCRAAPVLLCRLVKSVQDGVQGSREQFFGLVVGDPAKLAVRVMFHGVCGSIHDAIRSKKPIRAGVLIETAGRLAQTVFALGNPPTPSSARKEPLITRPAHKVHSRSRQKNA